LYSLYAWLNKVSVKKETKADICHSTIALKKTLVMFKLGKVYNDFV